MGKVFLVECGEYSDYSIVAAFSTRELAETAIGDREGYSVLEMDLDRGVEQMRDGLSFYRVKMLRDGAVEECHKFAFWNELTEAKVVRRSEWPDIPSIKGYNGPDFMEVTLFAKDETQAIKAANERRAKLVAEGQWD